MVRSRHLLCYCSSSCRSCRASFRCQLCEIPPPSIEHREVGGRQLPEGPFWLAQRGTDGGAAESRRGIQPRTTLTRCVSAVVGEPDSRAGFTAVASQRPPSSSTGRRRGSRRAGSRRRSRSAASGSGTSISKPGQARGMQGSMHERRARAAGSPRIHSSPAGTSSRPSRCTRSSRRGRRAAARRRRRRPRRTARPCSGGRRRGVLAWLIGLSIENSSPALSPSPSAANAITAQIAAWVYWPPFSRTPGR